jgi:hypothetical protein
MEEQNTKTNWLDQEVETLSTNFDGERLEPLKLETGKITTFKVNFDNPFKTWDDGQGVTKAIIPVKHGNELKNLWLNKKNPLYGELCKRGKEGQTEFKVATAGTKRDTRYTIVTEEKIKEEKVEVTEEKVKPN